MFTVGYLLGYSGQKENHPIVKFGRVSMTSNEAWYKGPSSGVMEQGYILDLANAPGLSGAPVFTYGVEIEVNPFRFRELPPYAFGVVKGMMTAVVNGQSVSQGVAMIEPAANLKKLMEAVAAELQRGGADIVPIK